MRNYPNRDKKLGSVAVGSQLRGSWHASLIISGSPPPSTTPAEISTWGGGVGVATCRPSAPLGRPVSLPRALKLRHVRRASAECVRAARAEPCWRAAESPGADAAAAAGSGHPAAARSAATSRQHEHGVRRAARGNHHAQVSHLLNTPSR